MSQHTSRRAFFQSCALVAGGAAAARFGPWLLSSPAALGAAQNPGAEERLRQLGIELPSPGTPVATYVPAVRVQDLLFVSGTGPRQADGTFITGKVGADLDLEQGRAAARQVGLNVLGIARASLGSLDKVVRLVKVLGMVNSTPDFTEHPQVINGFSDLMVEVFGDAAGKGARSAVGMASLPFQIAVEIEAIFQVTT